MRARVYAAALILLSIPACQDGAGTSPSPEYDPTQAGSVDQAMCLLGFEAVPLRQVQPGHHLVEATINGRAARFVLDTGANVTVIDRSLAEEFDLSARAGLFGGEGALPQGAGRASQAGLDSFAIGPITIRQRTVVLADVGQLLGALGQVAGEDVAGLIGQDVMNEHRAIIDVARPMLYLMEEDRAPGPVPAERCGITSGEAGRGG